MIFFFLPEGTRTPRRQDIDTRVRATLAEPLLLLLLVLLLVLLLLHLKGEKYAL